MALKDRGKVLLSGFNLDKAEKSIANNLVQNYISKIKLRLGFKEVKLRLKKSRHGKTFLHEVQGTLLSPISKKLFKAKATDYNLFSAMADVFEKLMKEAEHKLRRQKARR